MFSRIYGAALLGIDAIRVAVEVDIASGLPELATVGRPEGAVRESKVRVRAALRNCGYPYPYQRITVNLAPADVRKEGSGY
ncbi:MAG: ATP-dependent protease, partial [Deltaproteobacteria bacterium]|nr:ATP-dependent protease [Deltaproteobacteria bacterium]